MYNHARRRVLRTLFVSIVLLGTVLVLFVAQSPTTQAAGSIIVNTTSDAVSSSDGICSLREAVYAANTNTASGGVAGECAAGSPGADTINITATGTIAILGYLPDITETLTINGPVGRVTIDGSGVTRSGFATGDNVTLTLSNLNIVNGYFAIGVGGAIALGGGVVLNVTNSTFSNNYSGYDGGAIWNPSPTSTVTINNSTFYSNTAGPASPGLGGAIYSIGPLTITNSTFYSNSVIGAPGSVAGGAIWIYQSTMAITNSTFYGNSGAAGGAIYTTLTNTTTIVNSTFANNNSSCCGGALFVNGSITLTNSIIAGNLPNNCSGTISDGGLNLRWPTSDATCVGAFGDPRLAPLGNYGGATKTMGLFLGSPAIDAVTGNVNCPATDQRGILRPQGTRCDIGAFEGTLYPLYLPLIMR